MDGVYFYQQDGYHYPQKRYRKMPEDLPDSLKFAHLNPKVAAFLANKEKQKQEGDLFGDGLGNKSLMPEINQAFVQVKNRLDSSLINDEDSQRFLFEEAKFSARSILYQLAQIIYSYDGLVDIIPKSLEYQLMQNYKDLTADVIIVPRQWQTINGKENQKKGNEFQSEDDLVGGEDDGKSTKGSKSDATKSKKKSQKPLALPEIVEDDRTTAPAPMTRRSMESKHSAQSKKESHIRGKSSLQVDSSRISVAGSNRSPGNKRDDHLAALTETPSDARSTAGNTSYYMCTIQFQLSSKLCEEKGWIVQKGREDEIAHETLLEWCVQILQHCMKFIHQQKLSEAEIGFDKPVQVRYYGDTRKETLLRYRISPVKPTLNPAIKGQKPLIPYMYDDRNEGKQLMLTSHLDATTVAYYPTGRPAVVCCAAGMGRQGYYTIAYNDDVDMKMLACFTPTGRGCCYHTNGIVRFLATTEGGHLANEEGSTTHKWKWPPGSVKITNPISFQLNHSLAFRCVTQNSMVLYFNCMRESAKFSVAPTVGATDTPDENEQLLTTFTFSSRAARELLRLYAPKPKTKPKSKKKDKYRGTLAELQKMLEFQELAQYDTEAEKDLARLQRKARILIDDWLEHYRLTLGMSTPTLSTLSDRPDYRRRYAQSARLAGTTSSYLKLKSLGAERTGETPEPSPRAPSAPLVSVKRKSLSESSGRQSAGTVRTSTVKFEETAPEDTQGQGDGRIASTTAIEVLTRLTEAGSRAQSARSCKSTRQHTNISLPDRIRSATVYHKSCPVAVRGYLLGGEKTQCRCNRYMIPSVTDIEFDEFIIREAPAIQMQIVCVISSLYSVTTGPENMLNQLHSNMNRNRTRPCTQCRADAFRIYKYDINTAADMSDHTQPLLLTRHNVVPGMFLIYASGKLLFCDHIFNGYGNTSRKDFKKQIMKSRLEALQGFSLPRDFRFSPSRGRHGPRSAWGGEIGGAGVDIYGSPGTSVSTAVVPRLSSSDSNESTSAALTRVKEIYRRIGALLNMVPWRNLNPVVQFISQSLSPHGYFPAYDMKTTATSPLKRITTASSVPATTG